LRDGVIFYVTLSGTRGFPKRYIENVMVSAGSLWSSQRGKFIRRNPPEHTRFFLDSGGFSLLNRYGDFPFSREEYLGLIWHYEPDYAATMDYPCEPDINRKIYLGSGEASKALRTNEERIKATVDNAVWLLEREVPAPTTIVPVIQGYTAEEYIRCIDMYERRGVFEVADYFGIGSMCRRWRTDDIAKLVVKLVNYVWSTHPHVKFHMFGLKLSALRHKAIYDRTHSVDSAAWSLNPKRGKLYVRDPVGAGYLDQYLEKVSRVCAGHLAQRTLEEVVG